MLACVDVDYNETRTCAACLVFADWPSAQAQQECVVRRPPQEAAQYVPGEFYRRELPAVLAVLQETAALDPRAPPVSTVIIDGYVWLGPERPGMGLHLHQALGGEIAIVGIAKNPFAGNALAIPVLRGESKKPLFITTQGMEPQLAADAIVSMAGDYRVPTLAQRVDRLCREG